PQLRHDRLHGHDGGDRGLDSAGEPRRHAHHVEHHAGAVPLPARPRGGPRHHRGPGARDATAGGRQLRPRPRSLPDRYHRRPAGPAGGPAGEDRLRPRGGGRREAEPRAVRDPPSHRPRSSRASARAPRERAVTPPRTAADRHGRLLARDARVVIDNGAYVSWGSTTPYVMLSTTAGLYRVPAVRFDTTIVYTNNPYSGSMRGYGNLESTFAIEAQMDDLAERLGLDRVEIRRRNATRPGDVNPQGNVITSCAMIEGLEVVGRERGRLLGGAPRAGWRRGVGYAAMFHVGGGARVYRSDGCGAILKLDDFGKVSLLTGASEIGQGSETVLAMIVAE